MTNKIELYEFMAGCPDSRLGSIIYAQLVEDVDYMTFYGVRTDRKDFGNFSIGGAFSNQPEHFYLAASEICLNFKTVFF